MIKEEYIVEELSSDFNWSYSFAKILFSKEDVEHYQLRHKNKKLNIIEINSNIAKKAYFINALKALDYELSPENLSCDGELSVEETLVKERDIFSRIMRMERESGFVLKPLLNVYSS